VRRGERNGGALHWDGHDDGDAGDAELSEYAYELCKLHFGRVAERGWTGDNGDLDRIDYGCDADCEYRIDGKHGVYGEVLVRRELVLDSVD
jgi:hypothetical protein